VRRLNPSDAPALRQLLAVNPASNVFVSSRIDEGALQSTFGEIIGYFANDQLQSALYVGSNLVPVALTDNAISAFGLEMRRRTRTFSSIVGHRQQVLGLWHAMAMTHGPARIIRERQPYMALTQLRDVVRHTELRRATAHDIDSYFAASVEMFTAEVEMDPTAHGPAAYRARVLETLNTGRGFGWFDSAGNTLFKLDVGSISQGICQIQGVWLHPQLRGQGLAPSLVAAAVDLIQRDIAPTVGLYVNDFNLPARRTYEAVGFEQIDEFATIFF
jgi:predicted GNAT family acetyltransferase